MPERKKAQPIILRLDSLATSGQRDWLRMAGVDTPRFREHAELLVEEIQGDWQGKTATPLQERFLRLRGRWRDGLSQREAFYLVSTIADHERNSELEAGAAPSWERLVELEPRLQELFEEACSPPITARPYCRMASWYGPGPEALKVRLARLVGLGAEQPGLLTSVEAYRVAYETVFAALPECDENCCCEGT
jgi:hypothetical protein